MRNGRPLSHKPPLPQTTFMRAGRRIGQTNAGQTNKEIVQLISIAMLQFRPYEL